MPPFFQKRRGRTSQCLGWACLCVAAYGAGRRTRTVRIVRPSAGRTVAECLLSVPVVLGALDLAVELVEMSVPSAQKGQA